MRVRFTETTTRSFRAEMDKQELLNLLRDKHAHIDMPADDMIEIGVEEGNPAKLVLKWTTAATNRSGVKKI